MKRNKCLLFCSIPGEIMMNIFSYLLPQDLILASQVCKTWHRLANDKYVDIMTYHISLWYVYIRQTSSSALRLQIHVYLVNLKFLILKHLKSVQYLIGHFSNPLILYYMYYILINIWCVSVPFIWNTQFEISRPYFKIDDQFFQYSVETNIQEVLWYQNRWKWERGQT